MRKRTGNSKSRQPLYKNNTYVNFIYNNEAHIGLVRFVNAKFLLIFCEDLKRINREVVVEIDDVKGEADE